MLRGVWGPCAAVGSLTLALLAGPAAAAAGEAPEVLDALHVVRPGDTLEGVTRSFFGVAEPWRENWRRNPFVTDPDLLQPGWRLHILLRPESARPAAQLRQIARTVETQPAPQPWSRAERGMLLLERDGVRTFEGSSAELAFTDGNRLLVTENSLLFLRLPTRAPTPARPQTIEIVEGQADVELHAGAGQRAAVEVVLGAARATLRPPAAAVGQSRSRRATGGGAQVMVYRGEGAVEAAGKRVDLDEGSGTSVPASGPPAPREALLAEPRLLRPAADAPVEPAEVELAWQPVAGAVGYTVEICRDPDCGQLVARATGVAAEAWRPASPPEAGDYYWRATARSASGLDGYPATASRLAVREHVVRDQEPPIGSLVLASAQLPVAGKIFVLPDCEVRLVATDAAGPLARLERRVNGQAVGERGFAGPWADGNYALAAEAVDGAGNRSPLGPLVFTVDGTPPLLAAAGGAAAGGERTRRWLAEKAWSADTRRWTTWKWIDRDRDLRRTLPGLTWSVEDDPPAVVLTATEPLRVGGDLQLDLPAGQGLRVAASDAGCGLAEVRLRPRRASAAAGVALRVEVIASDRLGNERRLVLRVQRP